MGIVDLNLFNIIKNFAKKKMMNKEIAEKKKKQRNGRFFMQQYNGPAEASMTIEVVTNILFCDISPKNLKIVKVKRGI